MTKVKLNFLEQFKKFYGFQLKRHVYYSMYVLHGLKIGLKVHYSKKSMTAACQKMSRHATFSSMQFWRLLQTKSMVHDANMQTAHICVSKLLKYYPITQMKVFIINLIQHHLMRDSIIVATYNLEN